VILISWFLIQEVVTLLVFAVFSVLYSGEELKWNYLVGFLCIIAAGFFVFHKWQPRHSRTKVLCKKTHCLATLPLAMTCAVIASKAEQSQGTIQCMQYVN
jgi:hypothetical protein